MPAPRPVHMLGLATALPEFTADSSHTAGFMERVLQAAPPGPDRDRTLVVLKKIFRNTGIGRRYSVIPDYLEHDPEKFEFFPKNWEMEPFPTTADRMKTFEKHAVPLAERAGRAALEDGDVDPSSITHIIITTCTGFFAPGPDILLSSLLGLPRNVRRTVLGFMGCYAGFNGMRSAQDIVAADPDARVLLVSVELCTIHFQKLARPEFLLANCLFGDGAAAAVFGTNGNGQKTRARLEATYSAVQPDTLEDMTWRIGDSGYEMTLSVEIPKALGQSLPGFAAAVMDHAGVRREDVTGWAIHPGGRRILDRTEEVLELSEAQIATSRKVLQDVGNLSSPTIFFVIDEMLKNGTPPGPILALGFGPGLTLEGAILTKEH